MQLFRNRGSNKDVGSGLGGAELGGGGADILKTPEAGSPPSSPDVAAGDLLKSTINRRDADTHATLTGTASGSVLREAEQLDPQSASILAGPPETEADKARLVDETINDASRAAMATEITPQPKPADQPTIVDAQIGVTPIDTAVAREPIDASVRGTPVDALIPPNPIDYTGVTPKPIDAQIQADPNARVSKDRGGLKGFVNRFRPDSKATQTTTPPVSPSQSVTSPDTNSAPASGTQTEAPEATQLVEDLDQGISLDPNVASATPAEARPVGAATWRNADHDQPVVVTEYLGKGPDGKDYVKVEGSDTGIPLDEINFPETTPVVTPADSEPGAIAAAKVALGEISEENKHKRQAGGTAYQEPAAADPLKEAHARQTSDSELLARGETRRPYGTLIDPVAAQREAEASRGGTPLPLTPERQTLDAQLTDLRNSGLSLSDLAERVQIDGGTTTINGKTYTREQVVAMTGRARELSGQPARSAEQSPTTNTPTENADRAARRKAIEDKREELLTEAIQQPWTEEQARRYADLDRQYQELGESPEAQRERVIDELNKGEPLTPERRAILQGTTNETGIPAEVPPEEQLEQLRGRLESLYTETRDANLSPAEMAKKTAELQQVWDKVNNIHKSQAQEEEGKAFAEFILNPDSQKNSKITEKQRELQKDIQQRIFKIMDLERRVMTQKDRLRKLKDEKRTLARELEAEGTKRQVANMSEAERQKVYNKYLALNAKRAEINVTRYEASILNQQRDLELQYIRRKLGVTHGLQALIECSTAHVKGMMIDVDMKLDEMMGGPGDEDNAFGGLDYVWPF